MQSTDKQLVKDQHIKSYKNRVIVRQLASMAMVNSIASDRIELNN